MARTILIILMCVSSFMLFYPSTSFTGDVATKASCACGADCKCEHCTTGKGACACKAEAKDTCACGADCKCEHCTTGKGACACKAEAKDTCACGADCKCEHCTTGKGACACKAEAKDTCACGADCKCEHCTTGKGACACKAEAKDTCACGADCKCEHCTTGKGACACKAGSGKGAAAPGASKGLFKVSYKTDSESIPLNTLHAWTITVTDAEGKPVTDAEIAVDGGMPAHGHGLPTQPEVTKNLGNGSYLVEGVEFSMPGDWVVTFTVKSGGKEDIVVLDFGL